MIILNQEIQPNAQAESSVFAGVGIILLKIVVPESSGFSLSRLVRGWEVLEVFDEGIWAEARASAFILKCPNPSQYHLFVAGANPPRLRTKIRLQPNELVQVKGENLND